MIQRPCWADPEVGRIVKPDAEEIDDHVFRAVHCATELQIADTADGELISASPDSMVQRFLDPRRDYVQTVVLGESGTGKSHLIQWLRLHIPIDAETMLLTIPKTGTSLRGIVERLIARLPEEDRPPYEARLRQAGTHATSQEAKVSKFLDALAWAIGHGGLVSEAEDFDLASLLPDVLRDPNFREGFFLLPGGTVDQIVQHVFVDPDKRDGSTDRREFRQGDLPLDGKSYNDASRNAQEAIDYIKGESGMDGRAIILMNRNLDAAIAQTLNFSADNLIDLMNALRRHLARQGKRLILLIEDFARLQGIDTALLQALITPPGQGDERLCELRWAMAVTTGYFERLEQTVRTRTTFVVNMDLSTPVSLTRFTAGYLNALRWGETHLRGLPPTGEMPSRCSLCEKQENCFVAFGEIEGIGLFPFSKRAIMVMAERTESQMDERHFNPRKFLRSVLESVLFHHFSDLDHGEFPPEALLKRIGGTNALKPIDCQKLTQADASNATRRITLLELWDGTGSITNVTPGIHDAFGIPPLLDISSPLPPDSTPPPGLTPTPPLPDQVLPPHVDAVRRWARDQAMLPQNVVTELRQLVFASLEAFIDWDEVGYKKAMVASATGTSAIPFRQVSINFKNQQTQPGTSLVMLNLTTNAALPLEALLTYKHHGNWEFQDGGQLFANLLEALQTWSTDVEGQLKILFDGREDWNLVTAVVELLLIATFQSGRIKTGDAQIESTVARLWESGTAKPLSCLHRPFGELNGLLVKNYPRLLEMLRNLSSGTKGGVAGNFVRAEPVLRAVRSLRQRSLQLSQTPPVVLPSKELKDIADLYRQVQGEFVSGLAVEKENWRLWFASVQQVLGEEVSITVLSEALIEVITAAENQAINSGFTRKVLKDTLVAIKPRTLDQALGHARALEGANATETLIRISSIGDSREEIDRLCEQVTAFLEKAEATVANQHDELEQRSGAGLKESEMRIEQALDQLAHTLEGLDKLQGVSA